MLPREVWPFKLDFPLRVSGIVFEQNQHYPFGEAHIARNNTL